MDNKKVCPLKFLKTASFMESFKCEEEKCAWWCEWTKSCAMVAIPAELDNQAANIMQTMGN